jgi:ribonuclease P protein component
MGESGLAIKKTYRVKRSKDFDQIFSAKHSFANKRFVVYKLNTKSASFSCRAISKQESLGMRFCVIELNVFCAMPVAEFKPYLADEDFVIIARSGVETLSFEEVKKNLRHVLKLSKIYVDGEND